ncbi:MAG TPA: DUF1302 family protein, partial [Noviherbaspirillum sp.]
MRRVNLLCILLSLAAPAAALELNADISAGYAGHLHSTDPRTTERGMKLQGKLTHDEQHFGIRAEGRLRWNDAYRSDAYSEVARDAYRFSGDWRELYATSYVGGWNVSLGLQQVVWGKADNLRVVDQVNPVDLREFVLPDLNDYRKPVMMLRGVRMLGDWSLEMLYLPRFKPTSFAKPGSEYDIPLLDPQTLQSVLLLPEKRPSNRFSNGEVGMHLSRSFEALDLSLFAFHTWDDNPVYRTIMLPDAAGNPVPALQAEYRRQFMTGLSAARAIGHGMVIRAELAYVPNYAYMVSSGSADGLAESATLTGLVGLDYNWRDWLLAVQTSDRYIEDWNRAYAVRKHAQVVTFSATGSSLSGRLDSRIAYTTFPDSRDGNWLQLKSTWKPD